MINGSKQAGTAYRMPEDDPGDGEQGVVFADDAPLDAWRTARVINSISF